jgi:hypothetical protein
MGMRASSSLRICGVVGSLLLFGPAVAFSQGRASIRPTASLSVSLPGPLYPPRAAPLMVGVAAGLEGRRASLAVRPHLGFYRGIGPFGDDLSICLGPGPGPGQCYEPAYSRYAGTGGLDVVISPQRGHGLFAAVGGGLTVFGRQTAEVSRIDVPRARGHWRVGGGVTLGSSQRAPRLELARTTFTSAAGSAQRWTSFGLWLR